MTECLDIRLLGRVEMYVGNRCVARYTGRLPKPWALLALLALAPGHRLPVEQAYRIFWPGVAHANARRSLNEAVRDLRKALDDTRQGPSSPYLGHDRQTLWLCPHATLICDVEIFERQARAAATTNDPAMYERATALYSGDLVRFPEGAPAVEHLRERLRLLYIRTLIQHAAVLMDLGRGPEAMAIKQRFTREYPPDLFAARLLTTPATPEWHVAAGTPADAASEAPTSAPADAASDRSADVPTNVGVARHPLLGRQRELTAIHDALQFYQLVTLYGPGGSGKTTLAEEMARRLGHQDGVTQRYEGIWEVRLDQFLHHECIVAEVGRVLGLQLPEVVEPRHLVAALKDRHVLLILDNCEHVRGDVEKLCTHLLSSCPSLRILATSRSPLRLPHEHPLLVPPLDIPPSDQVDAKSVERWPAVRLFVARARSRARSRGTSFQLTDENAPTIARICRQVGGLPLAIELVSARLFPKPLAEIERDLDNLLNLSNHTDAAIPPRHRSLRKTLDWSFKLLSHHQKSVLIRLAIFKGGWTQRTAEICAGDDIPPHAMRRLLDQLLDWSFISAERTSTEPRYRMPEYIRHYLNQRLKRQKDYASLQARYAEWWARFAETAAGQLDTQAQVYTLRQLDQEQSNLRTALEWAIGKAQPELALRLVVALWRFWWIRGWIGDGINLIEQTLRLHDPTPTPQHALDSLYAQALAGLGLLLAEQGYWAPSAHHGLSQAEQRMCESIALLHALGEERALAAALSLAGMVAYSAEHLQIATCCLSESLKIRHRLRDETGIADCLKNLGTVAYYLAEHKLADGKMAEYKLAERRLLHCLRIRRQRGDLAGMAYAQINLANIAFKRGHYEIAEGYYLESLAWRWALNARGGIASCLAGLLVNAVSREHYLRAAWLSGVETELKRSLGVRLPPTDQQLYDQRMEECQRKSHDPAAFAAARARGLACPLDLAVACLLTANDRHPSAPQSPRPFDDMRSRLSQTITSGRREIAAHIVRGEALDAEREKSKRGKAAFDRALMAIPRRVRAELAAII